MVTFYHFVTIWPPGSKLWTVWFQSLPRRRVKIGVHVKMMVKALRLIGSMPWHLEVFMCNYSPMIHSNPLTSMTSPSFYRWKDKFTRTVTCLRSCGQEVTEPDLATPISISLYGFTETIQEVALEIWSFSQKVMRAPKSCTDPLSSWLSLTVVLIVYEHSFRAATKAQVVAAPGSHSV